MTRTLLLSQAGKAATVLAALLLVPTSATAQRATGTLIVRVEDAGAPAPGVDVAVVLRRTMQRVGTTGASGIVGVDELPLDIVRGTRVSVGILRCGAETSALLIPEFESLGEIPDSCGQVSAGHFYWGQSERIVIRLDGNQAVIQDTQTEDVRAALSGWRFQGSFLFTALGGEDFDDEGNGIGADVKLFYIWPSGIGIGGGGSWTRHDVSGLGEDMYKWSAYVEPRYTLFIPTTKLRPYALGRVSYNWFNFKGQSRLDENGFGFGGGLGVAYPITGWVGLDLGAYLGYISVSTDFEGTSFSRTGTELQLTAGLRFF